MVNSTIIKGGCQGGFWENAMQFLSIGAGALVQYEGNRFWVGPPMALAFGRGEAGLLYPHSKRVVVRVGRITRTCRLRKSRNSVFPVLVISNKNKGLCAVESYPTTSSQGHRAESKIAPTPFRSTSGWRTKESRVSSDTLVCIMHLSGKLFAASAAPTAWIALR
jgi:hypothetical protein